MCKIAFLNVCSLRRKVTELAQLMESVGAHLFGVAETWLNDTVADGELEIPNFVIVRKDRRHTGGGVAIYCHKLLLFVRHPDLESDDLEVKWLKIGGHGHKKLVGCIYWPPDTQVSYWGRLEQNIERALETGIEDLVLMGDFNADVSIASCHHASRLLQVCAQLGLRNHIYSPTSVTGTSLSTVDLLLTSMPIHIVHYTDISDHYAISACLSPLSKVSCGSNGGSCSRNLYKVNWDLFRQDLHSQLSGFHAHADLDESVEEWYSSILVVLDKHAPSLPRKPSKRRRPTPWLTDELVHLVREQNRLYRKLMKDKLNEALRMQHKHARRMARRLDRRLKQNYFREKCATAGNNQNALWKIVDKVTG